MIYDSDCKDPSSVSVKLNDCVFFLSQDEELCVFHWIWMYRKWRTWTPDSYLWSSCCCTIQVWQLLSYSHLSAF